MYPLREPSFYDEDAEEEEDGPLLPRCVMGAPLNVLLPSPPGINACPAQEPRVGPQERGEGIRPAQEVKGVREAQVCFAARAGDEG